MTMPEDRQEQELVNLETEAAELDEPVAEMPEALPKPVTPPPELPSGLEIEMPPETPEEDKKWKWVGDTSHPDNVSGDGVSDLFKVEDDYIADDPSDVTQLDVEEDVLDADEDGSLESVLGVDEEDILGEDLSGELEGEEEVDEAVFEPDIDDLLEGVDDDPFKERETAKSPTPARARRVRRTWKPYKPNTGLQGVS